MLSTPDLLGVVPGVESFRAFALSCLGLSLLWIAWSVTHALFFHPLSKFPGPMWARFTRIPFSTHSIMGTQAQWMLGLHETYGSVIRISPDELSYTDARAWKDIYGRQKGMEENPKAMDSQFEIAKVDSIFTVDAAEHTRLRQLFSPGFSERGLKMQEPLFHKYAKLLASKLRTLDEQERPADVTVMMNLTTFDIMAELTFGESLGLLDNNKYSDWLDHIVTSIRGLPVLQMIQYYSWTRKLLKRFEPKWATETKLATLKYAADRVDKRLERGSNQPDLWNLVESADGEPLTRDEMHANALLFMIAGSETTAINMTGLIYLLLVNPATLALLQAEVRRQAAAPSGLTFETLASLRYLNACIHEALRFYPPSPLGVPRIISHANGDGQLVCGEWVPSGTRVSVHQYAANHSTANFRDPERFAPERWLGDAVYEADQREARQPFSIGARNCLAQNMAHHEMRVVMATLMAGFDLRLCPESQDWGKDRVVHTLWDKVPLMVRFKAVCE